MIFTALIYLMTCVFPHTTAPNYEDCLMSGPSSESPTKRQRGEFWPVVEPGVVQHSLTLDPDCETLHGRFSLPNKGIQLFMRATLSNSEAEKLVKPCRNQEHTDQYKQDIMECLHEFLHIWFKIKIEQITINIKLDNQKPSIPLKSIIQMIPELLKPNTEEAYVHSSELIKIIKQYLDSSDPVYENLIYKIFVCAYNLCTDLHIPVLTIEATLGKHKLTIKCNSMRDWEFTITEYPVSINPLNRLDSSIKMWTIKDGKIVSAEYYQNRGWI